MNKKIIRFFYSICLVLITTQCSGGNRNTVLKEIVKEEEKVSVSEVDPGRVPTIVLATPGTQSPATPTVILPTPMPAPFFNKGEPIDDFLFKTLDGTIINSSEQIGAPIIIVAWKAACPYCKRYLPMLQETYEKYTGDFEIWALNLRDSPEVIRKYVVENGLTFTIWPDEKGDVFYTNNIATTPTTLFINKEGVVELIQEGIISEEVFIAKLEELEFIQKEP